MKPSEEETRLKLQELIEEGVLVEIGPEEVVLSEGYLTLLKKALKEMRDGEIVGEESLEDLLYGASMFAYIYFKGSADETELPIKVSLITTILECIKDNSLEEWVMKTRIRGLK